MNEAKRKRRRYRRMFLLDELNVAAEILMKHPPLSCPCGSKRVKIGLENGVVFMECADCRKTYVLHGNCCKTFYNP